MDACVALFVVLAAGGVAAWVLLIGFRWLFCRAVVVAGDAKLLTECSKCKYSLEGLGTSPTCPECNTHHSTIYTTHSRTEWRLRHELAWHWAVAALWCIGSWWFFAYAFPPIMTSVVYWSKGWSAAQRIQQFMDSRLYPWQSVDLAASMAMMWVAGCALSLRSRKRRLSVAYAICGVAALTVSSLDALSSTAWVDDWYRYFWDLNANPAAATIWILSIGTLVICMLIDGIAYVNRPPTSFPDAALSVSATSKVSTSDAAAS